MPSVFGAAQSTDSAIPANSQSIRDRTELVGLRWPWTVADCAMLVDKFINVADTSVSLWRLGAAIMHGNAYQTL